MFDHIEPSHVEAAVQRMRQVSRGVKKETKDNLVELTNSFHESRNWEIVCARWEQLLREAIDEDDEDGMKVHACVMALFAILFGIGFDSGFQALADTQVEKLLSPPKQLPSPKES